MKLEARPVVVDSQPDQFGRKFQPNRDMRGIRRMLGDVGKGFLRDPVYRFRGCTVWLDPIPGLFGMEPDGYSRFTLPLNSQINKRRSQVAAKGDA